MRKIFITLVIVLAATALQAQPASENTRKNAISISPIHLMLPVVLINYSYGVTDKIAVSPSIGYGKVPISEGSSDKFDVWDLRLGVEYYFYGSAIAGFFAGPRFEYVYVSGTTSENVVGTGAGGSLQALIGYHWVWNPGIFLDIKLGGGYMIVKAEAEDSTTKATAEEKNFHAVIDLNIGWAF